MPGRCLAPLFERAGSRPPSDPLKRARRAFVNLRRQRVRNRLARRSGRKPPAEPEDDAEADARVKAFLARKGPARRGAAARRLGMTARLVQRRHWRGDGTEPLPSGAEALGEPFTVFPAWFLRIECGCIQPAGAADRVAIRGGR